MSPTVTLDRVCVDAVDVARAAAVEVAGEAQVGEHVGVDLDGERLVTHRFASRDRAYPGWCWAVTVARASRAKTVTVDEVVLLPGSDTLLAPAWVPWEQRLRPGDLGVGDLLSTPADDPRLVPAVFDTGGDDDADEVVYELGLGRVRVLGSWGRDEAAERWYTSDAGPEAPIARAVPVSCASCGFFLRLAGPLRQAFGACANAFAPDDGRVVSVDHGCGAHSEIRVTGGTPVHVDAPLVDEFGYEDAGYDDAGSVDDADGAEPLGHS